MVIQIFFRGWESFFSGGIKDLHTCVAVTAVVRLLVILLL